MPLNLPMPESSGLTAQMEAIELPKTVKYTNDQRRQAAVAYACTGSLEHVERMLGIPRQTMADWAKSEWFQQLTQIARSQYRDQLDAQYQQIALEASAATLDSIRNGDEQLVKETKTDPETGKSISRVVRRRRKMSGKDLAIVASISTEKMLLLRNQPTSIAAKIDLSRMAAIMCQAADQPINITPQEDGGSPVHHDGKQNDGESM